MGCCAPPGAWAGRSYAAPALRYDPVRKDSICGTAQGIGAALMEDLVYDADGQLLASTLMDYALPTATTMPALEVHLAENDPSPINPLGVKGAGEDGTVGAGAAIANAVADALAPLGVTVRALPLSPWHVRGLIATACDQAEVT